MPKRHGLTYKPRDPFDVVIYFFTFATPLFEIPQIAQIYISHNAQSVSIWTWSFFVLSNIVWIIYGVRNILLPVILTSVLYAVVDIAIVVGIVLYS